MQHLQIVTDRIFVLPPRIGPRPRTRPALPHIQLEQWPTPEISQELLARSLELPFVRPRQSRMASPESLALALPDRLARGPAESFIDAHEFCHIHPLPEGSIHLTLPIELRTSAIVMGWGEQHPASRIGVMPDSLLMIYAPRDPWELTVVLQLISSSYQYARCGAVRDDHAVHHAGDCLG
jgi:phospholipase/carboxylesterase